MTKKIKLVFFVLGIIIFLSLLFFSIKIISLQKKENSKTEVLQEKPFIDFKEKETIITTSTSFTTPPEESTITESLKEIEEIKKPVLLFDFPLLFSKIKYPLIYAYEPESKTIRVYNLEERTFKEIYNIENLKLLEVSKSGFLIIGKVNNKVFLLDTLQDKKYDLPNYVQRGFFVKDKPYFIIVPNQAPPYIATFDNSLVKILDAYILDPEIDFLNNGFLILSSLKTALTSNLYIKNEKDINLILKDKRNLSLITNKQDLAFVSFEENGMWKSLLIDKDGSTKVEFNFGTLKEKCTFEEKLVCGVPKNQNSGFIYSWYLLKSSFDDDIVIYDPKENKMERIKIDNNFDILNPSITPLGIIFTNRTNSKLYLIPTKNFSL
jgi:hypothetical protein